MKASHRRVHAVLWALLAPGLLLLVLWAAWSRPAAGVSPSIDSVPNEPAETDSTESASTKSAPADPARTEDASP
ncbi:MAG: hypothetical protein AAF297_11170 [Planctomycetota bacterium]